MFRQAQHDSLRDERAFSTALRKPYNTMAQFNSEHQTDWKEILQRLSRIREQSDYTNANVDFIRENLLSSDERIRGGAVLAATGCLFEQHIIDLLSTIAEEDDSTGVRKAAVQSLGGVIEEGLEQGLEDEDFEPEDMEEWEEFQTETLQQEYLRIKDLMLGILQNEEEDLEVRDIALYNLSSLGFSEYIRNWISEFFDSPHQSSQITAVKSMGKYPYHWENELETLIDPKTAKPVLMEAISASYSSESPQLAERIENVLTSSNPDAEVICYALPVLANINLTKNLGELLQEFSLHSNEKVQEAAKAAIEVFTKKSFDKYLHDELGMDDVDI